MAIRSGRMLAKAPWAVKRVARAPAGAQWYV